LNELGQVIRQDFPRGAMMYECHPLRARMEIRDGVLTLEEAFLIQVKHRGDEHAQ
jgi:hypothetical protein